MDHQKWPQTHFSNILLGKEVVYVLPITFILEMLPIVRAGDIRTIQFGFHRG